MTRLIFALSFLFAITLNAQDFQTALAACVDDCDLRQFTGAQSVTVPVSINPTTTILVSRNLRVTVSRKITVPGTAAIIGGESSVGAGAMFQAAPGFNDDAVLECTGPCKLKNITVDGAARVNPQGQYIGLFLNRTYSGDHSFVVTFELENVQVQFVPVLQGIFIYSDPITANTSMGPNANQSCCGKMTRVRSVFNGGHGILIQNTADIFCSMCEFESNGGSGAFLLNAPTARWVQSDFGGNNKGDGLTIGPGSCGQIISGVQFGGDKSPMHDYSGQCAVAHAMSATETL